MQTYIPQRPRWTIALIVSGCSLLFILGCQSTKRQTEGKEFVRDEKRVDVEIPDDELAAQSRDIRINERILESREGARVVVPLFGDEVITFSFDHRDDFGASGYVWVGRALDHRETTARFAIAEGTLVGQIQTHDGRLFRFVPLQQGLHRLLEIDVKRLPWNCGATQEDVRNRQDDRGADTCATDPASDINVMVLYTDDARAGAGSASAMEATVFLAMSETNETYANSDVNQRVRLAYVAEISYTESGNSATDLNRLEATSDGQLDDVHSLRDTHAADIVILITETMESTIFGRARIMGTVANAFESSAFGVVKRINATGNFTFGHELGHIMGARHDWAGDSTNNSPYDFNHGYDEPMPSDTSVGHWRTVMARNSLGGTRLAYFSNPNINYPIGGSATDPMGIATGSQKADNHQTLNSTALTVANFRCSSPSANTVWMKDIWNDTGAEPDPATTGESMWKSPYIWVRHDADAGLLHQHEHENPEFGETNFIYVKLHNGFSTSTSGNLEVYSANASSSLVWPTGWTLIGTIPVTSFSANSTRIVEQSWNPPGQGHYCLVARWVSTSDPMATPEGSNIGVNVRNNNNLIWRNVNIVDLSSDESADAAFLVGNMSRDDSRSMLVFSAPGNGKPSFLATGDVTFELDEALLRAWSLGGAKSIGLERIGAGFRVGEAGGSLENLILPPQFQGRLRIVFRKLRSTPKTEFEIDVAQWVGKSLIGGVSYTIDTKLPLE